jgi:hypothetical protein
VTHLDTDQQEQVETRNTGKPRKVDFDTLAAALDAQPYAKAFAHVIPSSNRLRAVCLDAQQQEQAVRDAEATRPVVHERVLWLMQKFLELHQSAPRMAARFATGHHHCSGGGGGGGSGSHAAAAAEERATAERLAAFYSSLSLVDFLDRVLCQRPLVFFTPSDSHVLRDGSESAGGFDAIGTVDEEPASPYNLRDYKSYDEMPLAALLAVSTPTFFVNDGARSNVGRPGAPGTFTQHGVYVAQVSRDSRACCCVATRGRRLPIVVGAELAQSAAPPSMLLL